MLIPATGCAERSDVAVNALGRATGALAHATRNTLAALGIWLSY